MKLICLGSSSSGNCYLLRNRQETLAIEAGVNFKEVKMANDWKVSNIVGCLISHEHNDHAKFLNDFIKNGINVFALNDVYLSKGISNKPFCNRVTPLKGFIVGGFKVLPIPVNHDVPCIAYAITHRDIGNLLFITDTMMFEYKIPHLDHIMIEANYSDDILTYNIDNGIVPAGMRERLLHSHMEIKTTEGFLRSNDLSQAKEVILLHLSANNSNAEEFLTEVSKVAGKPVYVAHRGLELELSKEPY